MMEDDRLVQLALSRGYVTPEQVARAKAEQKTLADRGVDHGVYFLLQDLGLLSEENARDLRKSVSSSSVRALEIDGFVIQGRLGSGGMGDVFRSYHPDGRGAAIKLLSGKLVKNEEYVRRFLREARATMRLDHPHIVRTLSSGESFGTHYLMMAMVDGPSLKTWLVDRGKFHPDHAVILLRQMALALRYAWEHGVLHRDVKPANILLGPPRPGKIEPFCSMLCDFGLARVEAQAGETDASIGGLTGSGLALGTPHYMSPEQASGEHDLDQRADIYGLGATIYHALLGQTLYSGKSSAVIMYKQVTETVDLGLLRKAGIQEPLVVLIGRMLEKRRAERIATWAEVEPIAAALQIGPVASPLIVRNTTDVFPVSAPHQAAPAAPVATPQAPPVPVPLARVNVVGMVLATAGILMLVVTLIVGVLLSRGTKPMTVAPAEFAAAMTAVVALDAGQREIVLAPGTYDGPWRFGAAHAGLRLRVSGAGVVLRGPVNGPALVVDPGFLNASFQGIEIVAGERQLGIESVGGSSVHLADMVVRGGIRIGGSHVACDRVVVHGGCQISNRGTLRFSAGRLAHLLLDRADAQIEHTWVTGSAVVRGGSLQLDGVVIQVAVAPGLLLERCRGVLRDVVIQSPGIGLDASSAELTSVDGLTILGLGPAIQWDGDRLHAWQWSGFDLASPPRGLPGVLPKGPGARQDRLPTE